MSVIAIAGVTLQIPIIQMSKMLNRWIQGDFKVINFLNSDCGTSKTCYVKLSEKLDPAEVVKIINNAVKAKKNNVLNAFVPDTVPDLPEPVKSIFLRKRIRKKLGIASGDMTPDDVLKVAHIEIMTELQYKYTGLCNLSNKSSHALLDAIGVTVHDRLRHLLANGGEVASNPSLLTERYRTVHPHFGDFQLILSTMHRLQDAAGQPRTQLQEADLFFSTKNKSMRIGDNRRAKEYEAVCMYTNLVLEKLQMHVNQYQLTPRPGDSKEVAARRTVQTEMANMVPHMPAIMKELTMNQFSRPTIQNKHEKTRIYGEPYLPDDAVLLPMLKRYKVMRISRRKTMYNLMEFDVPINYFSKILAADGTYLRGSTIIVRPKNAAIHRVNLPKEEKSEAGETNCPKDQNKPEN